MKPIDNASVPTIPAVLDAFADSWPEALLLSADDRDLTAAEFVRLCREFASGLQATGLAKGSAVGVLLPNGWRWMVATLGAAYAGLVAVPLNTWYKEAELADATSRANLSLIITQRTVLGRDFVALTESAGIAEPGDAFRGTFFWDSGDTPFDRTGDPPKPAREIVDPADHALYVFTSGSSAAPKVVVLDHGNLIANGFAMGERQGLGEGERIWFTSPLFFGYGCANAVMVALTHGATICFQERFEALDSARFASERRCTVFYGLGQVIRALVDAKATAAYDLSALRTGAIGLSPEEKRMAVEDLGIRDGCSVYGLTENYGLCTMTEPGDRLEIVMNTVGRPLPAHQMRITALGSGEPIEETDGSRLGEIQLRGCITPGYLDNPQSNDEAFTSDGWFRSGDLGWFDGDGRLHYGGRIKEVVKIRSITISPAEVETFVCTHPDVDQAYVFGWPAADGTEQLACGVVVKPGVCMGADFEAELRNWLRERLSSYKVPSVFVFLGSTEVPLTATGKVNKRLIGEQFLAKQSVSTHQERSRSKQ